MKRTILWGTVAGIMGISLMCERRPVAPPDEPDPMYIRGLSARYIADSNAVELTWDPLDSTEHEFDFYRIYRTTETDEANNVLVGTLKSTGVRTMIDPSSTKFMDILALDNAVYYYAIRAVKVSRRDTVLGAFDFEHPGADGIVSAEVGGDVFFNINRGDLFTTTDRCSLVVSDPQDKIATVRFTQNKRTYLVKPDDRIEVNFDNPANPPSAAEINRLIAEGWLTTAGNLAEGVARKVVADFDANDPRNRQSIHRMKSSGDASFVWLLKKGNGTKRVWAELAYDKGDNAGTKDTIADDIDIAPWRIRFDFRNRTGTSDETMRKRADVRYEGAVDINFFRPWIRFSVSVFADTTMNPEFDYWLVVPDSQLTIYKDVEANAAKAWLETVPRRARLTGIGAAHDPDAVYTYMFHPDSAETRENLAYLTKTFKSPQTDLAFRLMGENNLNETCVPGSYFGSNPLRWNTRTGSYDSTQTRLRGNVEKMFAHVKALGRIDLSTSGKKQAMLVTRFTGKYFDDVRVMVSTSRVLYGDWQGDRVFLDFYPPEINFKETEEIGNYSVITSGSFDFELGTNPSARDRGYADIVDVRLMIAQKPATLEWSADNSNNALATADTISIGSVRQFRHEIFPYDIKVFQPTLRDIKWEGIDVSNWPSGEYIMGIITRDQFGNEGWAPQSEGSKTNPWLVTILTGK